MTKWDVLEHVLVGNPEKVPLEFWADQEFVFHAIHWNGFNFRFANDDLKKLNKTSGIGEDEERRAQQEIEQLTKKYISAVDNKVSQKEQELLEI